MQISIELQYSHTSIQISFALSEYDSSVLVLQQQIIKLMQYMFVVKFLVFLCGTARVLCSICKFFAMRHSLRTESRRCSVGAVQ